MCGNAVISVDLSIWENRTEKYFILKYNIEWNVQIVNFCKMISMMSDYYAYMAKNPLIIRNNCMGM